MTKQYPIPESLIRTNEEQRGPEGTAWLAEIPDILAHCEKRWSLTIGRPFPNLSYNYAARATRNDGSNVVVKVCYPDKEYLTEAEALRAYAGRGAVLLLDSDPSRGAMMLEDIRPGTLLS